MSEAIMVAVIAALASIAGTLIVLSSARKKEAVERAKREQHVDDRLKSIEKKLDEHNGYAARFEKIGIDIAEIKTNLRNLKE